MGLFSRKGDSYDSIFDDFASFVVNEYKQLKWTVKRKERNLTAMGRNKVFL